MYLATRIKKEARSTVQPKPMEVTPVISGIPLEIYAAFERQRAGLLYAFQGLAGLAMEAIGLLCDSSRWTLGLALLLPYAAYFGLRNTLWIRLYRRHGHLMAVKSLREARSSVAVLAGVVLALALLPSLATPGTLAALGLRLGWLAVALLVAVGVGRFPADLPITVWAISVWLGVTQTGGLSIAQALVMSLVGIALAGYGVWEHLWFRRTVG
jgi:hypothetical protein